MKNKFPNIKIKGKKGGIEDLEISEKNKKLIESFIKDIVAEGLSGSGGQKYRRSLILLAFVLEKDFDKATRQEIKALNGVINDSWYSAWTKHDFRIALRRAYKFWKGNNDFYPEEVKDVAPPKKERTEARGLHLPEKMLEKNDIDKLVKLCKNSRDKFMIWFMWDTAIRPCELRDLKWKDFNETPTGIRVHINTRKESGDFNDRHLLLYSSPPFLSRWKEDYEDKFGSIEENKDSFVFVKLNSNTPEVQLSHGTITKLFEELEKKSGIKKLTPYVIRHSKITDWCRTLPEFIVKALSGHAKSSDAITYYQHYTSQDLDEAILNAEGDKEAVEKAKLKQKRNEEFRPEVCPRCKELNKNKADICRKCGAPLTNEAYTKMLQGLQNSNKDDKDTIGLGNTILELSQIPEFRKTLGDFMEIFKNTGGKSKKELRKMEEEAWESYHDMMEEKENLNKLSPEARKKIMSYSPKEREKLIKEFEEDEKKINAEIKVKKIKKK